jgi:hypothetical protein
MERTHGNGWGTPLKGSDLKEIHYSGTALFQPPGEEFFLLTVGKQNHNSGIMRG